MNKNIMLTSRLSFYPCSYQTQVKSVLKILCSFYLFFNQFMDFYIELRKLYVLCHWLWLND